MVLFLSSLSILAATGQNNWLTASVAGVIAGGKPVVDVLKTWTKKIGSPGRARRVARARPVTKSQLSGDPATGSRVATFWRIVTINRVGWGL
jgi:hypothetical protein